MTEKQKQTDPLAAAQAELLEAQRAYDEAVHTPTARMAPDVKVQHLRRCTSLLEAKREVKQRVIRLSHNKG